MEAPALRLLIAGSICVNRSALVRAPSRVVTPAYTTLLEVLGAARDQHSAHRPMVFRSTLRAYEAVFDRSVLPTYPLRPCAGVLLFHDGSDASLFELRQRAFLYRCCAPLAANARKGLLVAIDGCALRNERANDEAESKVRQALEEAGWNANELVLSRVDVLAARSDEAWRSALLDLRARLDECVDEWHPGDEGFLLPVDDVFNIRGRGTVVVGCVERGSIAVGSSVELVGLGAQQRSTVDGLELFRKLVDTVVFGETVGMLLRDIERNSIDRGMWVVTPGTVSATTTFRARIERVPSTWKRSGNEVPCVLCDAIRVGVQIEMLDDEALVRSERLLPFEAQRAIALHDQRSGELLAVAHATRLSS